MASITKEDVLYDWLELLSLVLVPTEREQYVTSFIKNS